MVNKIAVLIPTYVRHERIKSIVSNIKEASEQSVSVYFIIEREDFDSISEIKKAQSMSDLCLNIVYNEAPNTHVSAMNTGYAKTKEPFVFCSADDVRYLPGWDVNLLAQFTGKTEIVGCYDPRFVVTATKKHAEHFMIKRTKKRKYIYESCYEHYYCDIELIQRSIKEGVFTLGEVETVQHLNTILPVDNTYKKEKLKLENDRKTYEKRRNDFEQYLLDEMFKGRLYPVNHKKLSIVLPSYNVLPYLKSTLLSLAENTYHNFELIIIDDDSNEETKEFLSAISDICTVIYNKNQKYVTSNWNTGIRMATGDYIAIINNDLKFSKNWDVHLMQALEYPDTWIASPYMTDPLDPKPFANVQRFNNISLAGPCFMIKKEMIQHTGYIPECTRIWYNDVWFSWITTQVFNKKSVFIRDALIHHYKSKSSEAMSELMRSKFVEIISADEKAFKKIQSDFETKGILYKEE